MGYGRSSLGITPLLAVVGSGTAGVTNTMATLNNAVSMRFVAPDTRDVKSVYLNWSSVTSPGTVQVRIETDSGGKPSGTLYDASATVDITPVAGWQLCTFATLPTTGLTAGNLYHVVAITTVAGATQTLRRSWAPAGGSYPVNALAAADGSTRTNFTENSGSVPVSTLVLEDNVEESLGFAPFAGSSNFAVYGTRAFGVKFVVPTGVTLSVVGATAEGMLRNGTPDDLRVRIFDSSNVLVTGASVTLPKGGLLNGSGQRLIGRFPAAASLAAGTYRIVWDQVANTSTSGNNWSFYAASHRTSALAPSYFTLTTTTDITAGTPTWTDTATDVPLVGLQLNDASGTGGGGTSTDPGIANVRGGIGYTINGTALTGTAVIVSLANTKVGVAGDGGTGTYDGSDRWTDPGVATVQTSVTYKANSTTNNRTGTYDPVTGNYTDPGIANVASGTTYTFAGSVLTGTLTGGGTGMTLSQLQSELTTRGLTSSFTTAVNAGVKISVGTGTGQLSIASGVVAANVTQVNGVAAGTSDGTAQGGTSNTIILASTASSVDGTYVDRPITITANTGVDQSRLIIAYNGTTKEATVHRVWVTIPNATSTYAIDPTAATNVVEWLGVAPSALILGRVDANTQATASALTFGLTGNITGNLSGSAGSVTGAVGSVGGNVTGSVGSIATGGIAATSFAADAISAASVSAAAVTKIQAGLSTYAGADTSGTTTLLTRIPGVVVAQTGDSFARIGSPAGASVSADLATIAAYVDTVESRLPAALVSGRMDCSVGAVAAVAAKIKKNAALSGFSFVMTDSTNHVPTAGLTVTATRSLDGGAFAACANAVAAVSNGVYKIDLAAADLNANTVILRFTATGADDTLVSLVTQP